MVEYEFRWFKQVSEDALKCMPDYVLQYRTKELVADPAVHVNYSEWVTIPFVEEEV